MSELIEKQAIIDALLAKMDTIDDKPEVVLGLVVAAGMIKDMPSALEQEPCDDAELVSVRQELLDRGDEMVSFRQLVERFDEVEEEYKGTPWNLKQIYNNFNILIGEKPCDDCIRRSDIGLTDFEMVMCNGDYKEALKMLLDKIEKAPSVTPAEKVGRWIMHIDDLFPAESTMECNKCHEHQPITIDDNYCPSCGAKMQEVEE